MALARTDADPPCSTNRTSEGTSVLDLRKNRRVGLSAASVVPCSVRSSSDEASLSREKVSSNTRDGDGDGDVAARRAGDENITQRMFRYACWSLGWPS
jgi:hypothetical protein